MSNKPQIEMIINEDGTVHIRVIGMQGPECLTLTKELEDALGVVIQRVPFRGGYAGGQDQVARKNTIVVGS